MLTISRGGDFLAFEVLVPISILLFMAAFVVTARHVFVVSFACMGATTILAYWSDLVGFVSFGFIGLIAGMTVTSQIGLEVIGRLGELVVGRIMKACILFVIIILIIGYSFFNRDSVKSFLPYQIFYTIEALLYFITACLAVSIVRMDRLARYFVLMGEYTLLAYMTQMLIIRILATTSSSFGLPLTLMWLLNVIFSATALLFFLKGVVYLRHRFNFFNSSYNFVFR